MFDVETETLVPDSVVRYRLLKSGSAVSYSGVLEMWELDAVFRDYMSDLLAAADFDGYRWETPPICQATVDRPFEFALLNAPRFFTRPANARTYAAYFTDDTVDDGVVSFPNLRGDATLIVPSPQADSAAYGHLAAFIRQAPRQQIHSLWRVIARQVKSQLSSRPIWVSTAGGGVAWLHVRLDTSPKYYGYKPYRSVR